MFIAVDNGILNMKRVTTIEIDRDTQSEINYLFNDGGIIKEKFDSEENAQTKFDELAENTIFLQTNDERLVNSMYIKDVEKDFINNKRLVYVLYNGAPVKETYNSETEVDSALETLKSTLESMGEGGGEGSSVDLTPYLKKTDAASTYVPKTELVNLATQEDIADFITKSVNDLVNYYKKSEVDGLINAITTISLQVVSDKEQVTETNVIYFVPAENGEENVYDEYILVNDNPEKIGTSEVNLSEYLKKTDAEGTYAKIADIPDISNLATKTEVGLKADKTYVDTELEKKADATAIPTTTSQLTNNSDFTTKAYVDGLVGDVESLLGGI